MGQLIVALFRAIVVGLFAVWMFFTVFPHPDRRVVALAIVAIMVVIAPVVISLLRDLERPVPEPPAPVGLLAVMEQNIMEEVKPWYQSRAILGGAVAFVAGAAQLLGYSVTAADQAALVDGATQIGQLVAGVASLAGGAVAIWGRIRASKAIGSTKTA